MTTRTFPAAAAGLVVNVVVPRRARGRRWASRRGHRAVRGLPGDARVHPPAHPARVRRAVRVGAPLLRIVAVLAVGSIAGELLLPTAGLAGLALRALWAAGTRAAWSPMHCACAGRSPPRDAPRARGPSAAHGARGGRRGGRAPPARRAGAGSRRRAPGAARPQRPRRVGPDDLVPAGCCAARCTSSRARTIRGCWASPRRRARHERPAPGAARGDAAAADRAVGAVVRALEDEGRCRARSSPSGWAAKGRRRRTC